MLGIDFRTANRFDRFLDDLASDAPPDNAQSGIDPTLIATAQQMHALIAGGSARRVAAPVTLPPRLQSSPNRSHGHRGTVAAIWRILDTRPVSALATVGLLVLIILSGYFAVSRDHAVTTTGDVDYQVFVAKEDDYGLQQIDPLTLADLPDDLTLATLPSPEPVQSSEGDVYITWQASEDGSTLMRRETRFAERLRTVNIVVIDARTRVVRSQFSFANDRSSSYVLSGAGNRLAIGFGGPLVTDPPQTGLLRTDPPRWDIYDTNSGQLVTKLDQLQDRDPLGKGSGWFDPSGARFYRLAVDRNSVFPGPWSVQLVQHDAATGQELARLDLPNVRAGFWPSEELVDPSVCSATPGPPISREDWEWQGPVWATYSPGIAISPDGKTMVFVNPDGREMTMVNLDPLSVQPTMTIRDSQQASTPVAISESEENPCRTRVAQLRYVTYSRDGAAFYISGFDVFVVGESTANPEIFPLMRVSVANGHVEARRTVGRNLLHIQYPGGTLSPDGQYLYVLVSVDDDNPGVIVQRLDADSLDLLAQRKFDSFGSVAIVAKQE